MPHDTYRSAYQFPMPVVSVQRVQDGSKQGIYFKRNAMSEDGASYRRQ